MSRAIPFVLACAFAAVPRLVEACSCVSMSPCQLYASAGAVFAGEVIDVVEPPVKGAKVARLKVLRSYKGDARVGETVTLSLPRGSSASCSLDTKPGDRYVVHGGGAAGQYGSSLCQGSYGLRPGDPLPELPVPGGQVTGQLYRFVSGARGNERPGIAGVRVWVVTEDGPIETRTDADGRFRLIGVPQGPRLVRFDVGGGERAEERINLQFKDDCAVVYASPEAAGGLIGSVLDRGGKGVANAYVYAWKANDTSRTWERSTETGPSGVFRMDALNAGTYHVAVGLRNAPHSKFPYVPVYYPGVADVQAARTVEIGADRVTLPAIRLGDPLALVQIPAEIVCRDGTRPASAFVTAERLGHSLPLLPKDYSGMTPKVGPYRVDVLPGYRFAVRGEVVVHTKFPDGMEGQWTLPTESVEVDSANFPKAPVRLSSTLDRCDRPDKIFVDRP